jgi:hypothetical protein
MRPGEVAHLEDVALAILSFIDWTASFAQASTRPGDGVETGQLWTHSAVTTSAPTTSGKGERARQQVACNRHGAGMGCNETRVARIPRPSRVTS